MDSLTVNANFPLGALLIVVAMSAILPALFFINAHTSRVSGQPQAFNINKQLEPFLIIFMGLSVGFLIMAVIFFGILDPLKILTAIGAFLASVLIFKGQATRVRTQPQAFNKSRLLEPFLIILMGLSVGFLVLEVLHALFFIVAPIRMAT